MQPEQSGFSNAKAWLLPQTLPLFKKGGEGQKPAACCFLVQKGQLKPSTFQEQKNGRDGGYEDT